MELKVFSRRWGHNDTYIVKITETGWEISHVAIGGSCDSFGDPYLFENLNQDFINYPKDLGGYMDWLWRQARLQSMNEIQIQRHLNELGYWIQITERNTPLGLWQDFK